eukprot:6315142-Prymnesium_polylepis.1
MEVHGVADNLPARRLEHTNGGDAHAHSHVWKGEIDRDVRDGERERVGRRAAVALTDAGDAHKGHVVEAAVVVTCGELIVVRQDFGGEGVLAVGGQADDPHAAGADCIEEAHAVAAAEEGVRGGDNEAVARDGVAAGLHDEGHVEAHDAQRHGGEQERVERADHACVATSRVRGRECGPQLELTFFDSHTSSCCCMGA